LMHPLPLLCLCPVHPQGHAQSNERSLQTSHKQTQDNARYSELSAILPSRLQNRNFETMGVCYEINPTCHSLFVKLSLRMKTEVT